jgi:hypothetical protein
MNTSPNKTKNNLPFVPFENFLTSIFGTKFLSSKIMSVVKNDSRGSMKQKELILQMDYGI